MPKLKGFRHTVVSVTSICMCDVYARIPNESDLYMTFPLTVTLEKYKITRTFIIYSYLAIYVKIKVFLQPLLVLGTRRINSNSIKAYFLRDLDIVRWMADANSHPF